MLTLLHSGVEKRKQMEEEVRPCILFTLVNVDATRSKSDNTKRRLRRSRIDATLDKPGDAFIHCDALPIVRVAKRIPTSMRP